MNAIETISAGDIGLGAKGQTALWTASLAVMTAMMSSVLYAAATLGPMPQDMGGGSSVILLDFAPVPIAPEPGEDRLEATAADAMEASDDEALTATEDPAPAMEAEPTPQPTYPLEETPPIEEDAPIEHEQPVDAPAEPDEQITEDPLGVPPDAEAPLIEEELTLPQLAAIPADIARLRAQTPATIHPSPAPRQTAAPSAPPATSSQFAQQTAAPPAPQASPAPQISPQRWQGQLFAHLERFKSYPSAASQRREQGIVYIQFSIDAAGNILSSRIVRSSGHANLDQAASQMMRNASPVPRPPAELGNPVTLTAPIDFALR